MVKKILIAASNYWTSPYQVGSHHYARIFARNGWEVMFISDPISPLHFLAGDRSQINDRYAIYRGRVESGNKNINIYVPMSLMTPNEKPVFGSSFVINNWFRFTIPGMKKILRQYRFDRVDLLWFDSLVQHFWLDILNHDKAILRVSDRFEAFKKIGKNFRSIERKLLTGVDHIIYTARMLEGSLSDYKDKILFVPNGVDLDNFTGFDIKIPPDLENIPGPRVIYAGAIDEWFDTGLLIYLSDKLKHLSFVIIGSPNIDVSGLKVRQNVFFLGRKKYNTIPSYLYNSDAGIIPFDVKHPVVDSVNPIKLYEYMACGLPVVSVRWKELEYIDSPAYLVKEKDEFAAALLSALKDKNKEKYIEFARRNSWADRFLKIKKTVL